MTPFAQHVVAERYSQARAAWDQAFETVRKVVDNGLMQREARCFEVSQVLDLVNGLAQEKAWDIWEDTSAFLPAPLTWIEMSLRKNLSVGALLTETSGVVPTGGRGVSMRLAWWEKAESRVRWFPEVWFGTHLSRDAMMVPDNYSDHEKEGCKIGVAPFARALMAALHIINSPKHFQAVEHPEHRGFVKALRAKGVVVPGNPWREIKLQITVPNAEDTGTETMGGKKAYHFCRAHMRFKRGKVEFVRHHWRGDPEKGMTRRSYAVAP